MYSLGKSEIKFLFKGSAASVTIEKFRVVPTVLLSTTGVPDWVKENESFEFHRDLSMAYVEKQSSNNTLGSDYISFGAGYNTSTVNINVYLKYTEKIKSPVVTFSGNIIANTSAGDKLLSGFNQQFCGNTNALLQIASSGLPASREPVNIYSSNDSTAYFLINARYN